VFVFLAFSLDFLSFSLLLFLYVGSHPAWIYLHGIRLHRPKELTTPPHPFLSLSPRLDLLLRFPILLRVLVVTQHPIPSALVPPHVFKTLFHFPRPFFRPPPRRPNCRTFYSPFCSEKRPGVFSSESATLPSYGLSIKRSPVPTLRLFPPRWSALSSLFFPLL